MIALYKFYSYTLGIEEAQTNLFLKHEYTTKPTSQKKWGMDQLYALLL